MAAKANTDTPLHRQLLDGLTVKSRDDGTVHTIKSGDGKTVAEVCVGTKKTRLNFRAKLTLTGASKSWAGGGIVVTPDNLKAARAALLSATAAAKGPAAKQ